MKYQVNTRGFVCRASSLLLVLILTSSADAQSAAGTEKKVPAQTSGTAAQAAGMNTTDPKAGGVAGTGMGGSTNGAPNSSTGLGGGTVGTGMSVPGAAGSAISGETLPAK